MSIADLSKLSFATRLFALYQGTTSVVPPPAEMVRALESA
jgi:hypothetical protein